MPIIQSLLDLDFYKLTMHDFVCWGKYADVPVRYGLVNRTKSIKLAEYIDEKELREQLDAVRELRFTEAELSYCASIKNGDKPMFRDEYLEYLRGYRLSRGTLEIVDGNFKYEVFGPWREAILAEIIDLSIFTELYCRGAMERAGDRAPSDFYNEGVRRFEEKVDILSRRPDITFSEFGTRRRASRAWHHDYIVPHCIKRMPHQFVGTSNVYCAMKYGVTPVGTCAHEPFMVYGACAMDKSDKELIESQRKVLRDWWTRYGYGLSIALTDTWGSQFFFRQIFPEFARTWKGTRQDSGNPFAYGESMLQWYEQYGIDPQHTMIIFSDSLDVKRMIELADIFDSRIRVSFGVRTNGWGTNLTNDLGIPSISLVIKVVEAGGHGAVKLSDNLAKAIGRPEDIERIKQVAGYTGSLYEECRY